MKLRGRFALWFALATLVPIGAAAVGTREVLSRSSKEEFAKRLEDAKAKLREKIESTGREVSNAVTSTTALSDDLVGGLLLNLRKYGGELPVPHLRPLRDRSRNKMRGLSLDLLMIVDGNETVLAAPHYRMALDDVSAGRLARANTLEGRPFFTRETMIVGKVIEEVAVIEAAAAVRDGDYTVAVAGGRIVDERLLSSIRQPGSVDARIVDAKGEVVVEPASAKFGDSGEQFRVPLPGADGEPAAWVEVSVSDAELVNVLARLTRLTLLTALGALLATVLLGILVARRMTRDLEKVVDGANAVARGDLDKPVQVSRQDEIGAVARALNLMMLDLKESKERLAMAERVAAWQEIARRLAHEIKNPLTPIQMSVETLRKTYKKKHPSFDEIFDESTATVLEEAARLKKIVSEFSEFARMPKPQKQALDVNELVTSATALYKGSVDLEVVLGDVPEVDADRDSLSQVILNLLENARDAISQVEGGRIRVESRQTRGGKGVAMIFDDNGPGIAPDLRSKLFTPYFTTKHAKGGTGLGLAIVHRIISDHGGRISATDSPAGGARFLVELPAKGARPEDLSASIAGGLAS